MALGSCTATPPPPAQLSPCAPPVDAAQYHPAELRNYTYTPNGQLLFNPRNIRLGSPTPPSSDRPFPRTNKGVQVAVCLDHKQYAWTNENRVDFPLSDGDHALFAFLVRSHFESIKVPEAIFAKSITVRHGRLVGSRDYSGAAVVYNTPLGLHRIRPTDSLLLDFVLVHTDLAPDGHHLQMQLDEQAPWTVDQWQPYALSQVSEGEHRLRLTLLNAQGQRLAPTVEQSFRVEHLPEDVE